ncbi:MAG: winged helix DNA-binding protein [Eubacteriales bacterium]|nr:winged helix DNA-binding protein [Eubacteriales bacterium]
MNYHALAEELLDLHARTPHIQAERQTSRLVHGEIGVLNYLTVHGNQAYPKDLSRSLLVSTARIATVLNQLARTGLITRTRDPLDNRQTIVQLTEHGQQVISEHRRHMLNSMEEMLEFLGPEDAQTFVRILKKLLQFSASHPHPAPYGLRPRRNRGFR